MKYLTLLATISLIYVGCGGSANSAQHPPGPENPNNTESACIVEEENRILDFAQMSCEELENVEIPVTYPVEKWEEFHHHNECAHYTQYEGYLQGKHEHKKCWPVFIDADREIIRIAYENVCGDEYIKK